MRYFILFLAFFGASRSFAQQPDTVKIGSYVISVHDINFHENEYTIRFWMWMLYSNPNFDFVNQVEVPNAKVLEKPDVIIDSANGKKWVMMKMKAQMKQAWKVNDYPFDHQSLLVKVENTMFDAHSLVFDVDKKGSHYAPELSVEGWEISDFKVYKGTSEYKTAFGDPNATSQLSTYATFNIALELERDAWGLFFKIFIGMYIAFAIAMIAFVVPITNPEPKFGLPVGALFAAVGNKYIIDSILPETSSFTLVDLLHAFTFFSIFLTIAIAAYSLLEYKKGTTLHHKKLNYWGGIITLSLYTVSNLIVIGLAIFK